MQHLSVEAWHVAAGAAAAHSRGCHAGRYSVLMVLRSVCTFFGNAYSATRCCSPEGLVPVVPEQAPAGLPCLCGLLSSGDCPACHAF